MTDLQEAMLAEARARHGEIQPCSGREDLGECFTREKGMTLLWYNSVDGSTRVVIRKDALCNPS